MRRLLLAGVLSICFIAIVIAQSTGTATLTGSVTDASGAVVVPRANVTVSNPATGFVFTSVTTEEGTWYIPNLNPATYQLKIEATGFKTYLQNGIVLRTAEQPRLEVKLEIGEVTQSVEVTGAPPLLETETAASGQVLEGQTHREDPGATEGVLPHLPLYARDECHQRTTCGGAAAAVSWIHAGWCQCEGAGSGEPEAVTRR